MDLDLVGTQYSWLSSIVYVAQLIWQPASSYFLVRLPIAKYRELPFSLPVAVLFTLRLVFVVVFLWGTVVACSAAAKNFAGLITARFFLGIFEATVGESGNKIFRIFSTSCMSL